MIIDFDKLVKEAKKKKPDVDEGKLFASLCIGMMQAKNAYRGTRALTESEVPKGLEKAVRKYFATTIHKGSRPFELARLERSNINEEFIYAVPKDVYEEIFRDDPEFNKGLAEIGKKFNIRIKLPWYCYAK